MPWWLRGSGGFLQWMPSATCRIGLTLTTCCVCSVCGGRREGLPDAVDSSALEDSYTDVLWDWVLGEAWEQRDVPFPLQRVSPACHPLHAHQSNPSLPCLEVCPWQRGSSTSTSWMLKKIHLADRQTQFTIHLKDLTKLRKGNPAEQSNRRFPLKQKQWSKERNKGQHPGLQTLNLCSFTLQFWFISRGYLETFTSYFDIFFFKYFFYCVALIYHNKSISSVTDHGTKVFYQLSLLFLS